MITPEDYSKIPKEDFIRYLTCDCGHPAVFFPFGNPAHPHCMNCGSERIFRATKEEIYGRTGNTPR